MMASSEVSSKAPNKMATSGDDALITSTDPLHPANHICSLCHQFYGHGWVTGTGGGISIKHDKHVYLAPSGVQKELMKPTDIFVMDYDTRKYIRRPQVNSDSL
jgi:methylthioribulose-1-phosphate dehydratase